MAFVVFYFNFILYNLYKFIYLSNRLYKKLFLWLMLFNNLSIIAKLKIENNKFIIILIRKY